MKKIITLILIICLIIAQCGCSVQEEVVSDQDWLLNTYCSITVYQKDGQKFIDGAFAYAKEMEGILSRTIDSSIVAQFNASDSGASSNADVNELVELGLEYYTLTDGLFDITVGPVSSLWDFGADSPTVPDAARLAEGVKHTRAASKLHPVTTTRENADPAYSLQKDDPDLMIDLGGIAKGYIADKVREYLISQGVTKAVINLGGNVLTLGEKGDGQLWNVAVERPFNVDETELLENRDYMGIVSFAGGSVVTSGTYERKFTGPDGILYHHVLDSSTGYPVSTDLASATIIGESSARCDALSTSCLLMGGEKAQSFMATIPGYEYVFIYDDGTVVASENSGYHEK